MNKKVEKIKKNADYDFIVLGAGIAGITFARGLIGIEKKVKIIEKSKSVGGRIATRRDGEVRYDHGAQFYRVNKDERADFEEELIRDGVVHTWFETNTQKYQASQGGLTQVAKKLSQELNIEFNRKITKLIEHEGLIEVILDNNETRTCRHVVMTAPLPQNLEILKNSQITYPVDLEKIKYAPCLVGLFELENQNTNWTKLNYAESISAQVYSISNQLSKKVSSNPAFCVMMTPDWSRQNYEKDDSRVLAEISEFFKSHVKPHYTDIVIRKSQLKKWRYSHPTSVYHQSHVSLGQENKIHLIGDAFVGPSVRGAMKSADEFLKTISKIF